MNYGVFGTGMVGQAISNRLAELGHQVMVGTRDPSSNTEKLKDLNRAVAVGTFAQAAAFGARLFNAVNGAWSLEALKLAGAANINGKVLIDISNPLDFSKGMPPTLLVANTDSLGEQIQRTYADVKVVKALNTVTAAVMVNPRNLAGGDHHVFLCGNDAGAKQVVSEVLLEFGWLHILDLGDISAARGMEMYLPLWLRLWDTLGSGMFNVKLVK